MKSSCPVNGSASSDRRADSHTVRSWPAARLIRCNHSWSAPPTVSSWLNDVHLTLIIIFIGGSARTRRSPHSTHSQLPARTDIKIELCTSGPLRSSSQFKYFFSIDPFVSRIFYFERGVSQKSEMTFKTDDSYPVFVLIAKNISITRNV